MSRLTTLGLCVLLLMTAIMVWRSGGAPGERSEELGRQGEPRYRIEGLHALRTDEHGIPLVRLTADSADYFDGGAATLVNIRAEGLSGDAAPWALAAPSGTVAAGEKRLLLLPPVTGTGRWNTGEPFRFVGSHVYVDDRKRQFYSSEPLTLESATRNGKAKGFTAGFDGKSLKMTQPELSYVLAD